MNTEELRAALRAATPEMEPRPTLTADVMRGGVRRTRTRRLAIAGVTVAAAALVTVMANTGWQFLSEPYQVATDPRMTSATKGDLAGDKEFIEEVLDVWDDNAEPTVKVVTRPHVYWAGNTPAGRAAVVMQETESRDTVRGLVGIDARTQELALLVTDEPLIRQGRDMAYKFGPENRFVLALDQDEPQYVSDKATFDDAGKAVRAWRLMTEADGVELAELPPGSGPMDAKVVLGDPADGYAEEEIVDLYHADESAVNRAKNTPAGLGWGDPAGGAYMTWAGREPRHWNDQPWLAQRFGEGLQDSGLLDAASPVIAGGSSNWYVSVGNADGSMAIVGEYNDVHSGPGRLYTVLVDASGKVTNVVSSGPVKAGEPVPVLVKLPSGEWLAVSKGAQLGYRMATGQGVTGEQADRVVVLGDAVEIVVLRSGKSDVVAVPR